MDSPSASPERLVKITYKSRPKRKRDTEDDADAQSVAASDASQAEGTTSSPRRSPKMKKLSDMRPPDSTGSKKPEFKVPEANYKRARRESEVPDDASTSVKKTHIRSSSSITSLKQLQQSSSASPVSQKPVSIRGHKPNSSISMKNPAPSESELDDGASVADSILSTTRVRRTEAERIEYFNNQPEASDVEPHSVTCLRCKKKVGLGKRQTYAVKPWELHRVRCDAKVPPDMLLTANSSDDSAAQPAQKEKDQQSEAGAPSVSSRSTRTEAERKALLEADTRALAVEPDQVLCKRCKKWIRIAQKNSKYVLGNWEAHQQRCSGALPSSKVATAERKLRIVNDPRAKTFGPRHVECATCRNSIILEGEADYTLTCWENHKAECPEYVYDLCSSLILADQQCRLPQQKSSAQTPIKSPSEDLASSSSNTIHFPPQARPPPSVESSSTVVSPEAGEGTLQKKGTKRRLDETDLEPEDDDAPPANRPRAETYVPTEKEAPSVMGWFLMPIKSFIRGFKESIS
ncbi:hypothetical protein Moror_14047 [Moniliophthora roreri MCA 2997]|uniref:Uncharacterized protein n=1 Tax=Moniliophthora roreri (strain MCA 2997) TaxID=1381753 RepID=V2XQQ8_MONRO|nr:hypothetical protein Moror_14047 [Moniliophthora roreri MCA 2997]